MSDSVLPSFPGLTWNVMRKPVFSTTIKTSVSGREYRRQNYLYPRWQYKLSYDILRSRSVLPEMQQLAAFFNARSGSFDTWLYSDPDDRTATAQSIGVGNGTTTTFQFVRSFGGFTEPITSVDVTGGLALVYVNGVLKVKDVDYTLSPTCAVTFVVAPPAGHAVTWTGAFYWRCRFTADQLDFNQFMRQFWELRTLEFITVKP